MALAWATAQAEQQQQGGGSALSALLSSTDAASPSNLLLSCSSDGGGSAVPTSGGGYPGKEAASPSRAAAALSAGTGGTPAVASKAKPPARASGDDLPPGFILVLTQVLPDGLGDLVFGESAVHELQQIGPVVWLRCYTSGDNLPAGERLIADSVADLPYTAVCGGQTTLESVVGAARLQKLWAGARERFLAPWIFGLSPNEEILLKLALGSGKTFWAMTEYGRGMGNIHSYTGGLGAMIPTGWTVQGEPGGVFRSIRRAERTGTDWRRIFAERVGLGDRPDRVRLWWFYSRKDDEKKHDFRILDRGAAGERGARSSGARAVAKVVPVGPDGKIVTDSKEKTNGEKLAEQLFQAAADPDFKPNPNVSTAEASAGCAGALSQFIWGILYDRAYLPKATDDDGMVDVVVAPNVFTAWREANGGDHVVAEVVQLDLVRGPTLKETATPNGRRVFVVSARVPRTEMRSFLEHCEERVFTTGDQSLAEAMFMDKLPCIQPDAKVQQWQLALVAKAMGTVEQVPDLGVLLRRLCEDPAAREAARRASKSRSDEVERQIVQQLGGPPSTWSPTHQVLAKAGMMG